MAIRSTMALALVAGTAAAQQAPAASPAQEQTPAAVEPNPAATSQDQQPAAFKNGKEKLSYMFGADFGRSLRWQRIDVNVDLLVTALRDALSGKKLLMTDEEIITGLKAFEAERKLDFEHAKNMRSDRNKREAEAFFTENLKKADVVTLPSGLQYKILKMGDGKKPTLGDKVLCNYRGTLLDGTEFDSSYKRKQPATVPVKGLIKGWTEALQLMPVGSKWQLFIPPQIAYGEKIVGGVGPDAMIVFEVELLSIEEPEAVAAGNPNPAKK